MNALNTNPGIEGVIGGKFRICSGESGLPSGPGVPIPIELGEKGGMEIGPG